MKIAILLGLFAALAQATIVPRNVVIPDHLLNPRLTGAEWSRIYENQYYTPEVVDDSKPGTAPQPAGAGAIKVDSKVVGGSTATRGQFPWQVSVTMDGSSFCGGSIISESWVLTAGHCVDGVSSFRLVFGSNTPNGGETGSTSQITRAKILHQAYNAHNIANDIALIQLTTPLEWSTYIAAVKLPSWTDAGLSFAGSLVRVSGWGKTSDDAAGIASELQGADLTVITNNECANTFGSTIRNSNICTSGDGGKSPCNGDSGGPLIIFPTSGIWKQIGIVSFGATAGCEKGYPAAFVRVTSYLTWIETHTGIIVEA